jgi:hypothetical protein
MDGENVTTSFEDTTTMVDETVVDETTINDVSHHPTSGSPILNSSHTENITTQPVPTTPPVTETVPTTNPGSLDSSSSSSVSINDIDEIDGEMDSVDSESESEIGDSDVMSYSEIVDKILSTSRPRRTYRDLELVQFKGEEELRNMTDESYEKEKGRFYEVMLRNPMLKELSHNLVYRNWLQGRIRQNPNYVESLERFMVINGKFLNDQYYRSMIVGPNDSKQDIERSRIVGSHVPEIIFGTEPSSAIDQVFDYVKAYSVAIPVWLVNWFRFNRFRHWLIVRIVWSLLINILMAINILEAVITDTLNKNYYNALTGLTLILRIKYWRLFYVDDETTEVRSTGYSEEWVDLYTAWNYCFIYGCLNPDTLPRVWSKLVSAMYAVYEKPDADEESNTDISYREDRWLSARACTLGMLIAQAWVDPQIRNKEDWRNPEIVKGWGKINYKYAKEQLLSPIKSVVSFFKGL